MLQLAFKEHVVTLSRSLSSSWFTPAKASGSFICSSRTSAGRKNVSWHELEGRRFAKKHVNETISKIKVCKTCILVMAAYCLYIYTGRMEKDSLEIREMIIYGELRGVGGWKITAFVTLMCGQWL